MPLPTALPTRGINEARPGTDKPTRAGRRWRQSTAGINRKRTGRQTDRERDGRTKADRQTETDRQRQREGHTRSVISALRTFCCSVYAWRPSPHLLPAQAYSPSHCHRRRRRRPSLLLIARARGSNLHSNFHSRRKTTVRSALPASFLCPLISLTDQRSMPTFPLPLPTRGLGPTQQTAPHTAKGVVAPGISTCIPSSLIFQVPSASSTRRSARYPLYAALRAISVSRAVAAEAADAPPKTPPSPPAPPAAGGTNP